jgi:hypothetical protein
MRNVGVVWYLDNIVVEGQVIPVPMSKEDGDKELPSLESLWWPWANY